MNDTNAELNIVGHQVMNLERPKKPKMLVVDDEPDNLDLLYRTFRRDFTVLRAESGLVALEILAAEGEVAVIISDQRMPEMKGTEFLSKTVPQFPNTMRIILTGFTDVEDLVEAINSGQVYKYITKPWDPDELKRVVQRAVETYELLKQRTEELYRAQIQMTLLSAITATIDHATQVEDCLQPIGTAFQQTFAADVWILQLLDGAMLGAQASSEQAGSLVNLVHEALATGKIQAMSHPMVMNPAVLATDGEAEIPSHLMLPVRFQERVLALLLLQWQQPKSLREDELLLLQLAAQQVGIVLTCVRQRSAVV